jgi:hypothetical protein
MMAEFTLSYGNRPVYFGISPALTEKFHQELLGRHFSVCSTNYFKIIKLFIKGKGKVSVLSTTP